MSAAGFTPSQRVRISRRFILPALACIVLIAAGIAAAEMLAPGPIDMTWNTIDGGGGSSTGPGGLELDGTIGQPDANMVPLTAGTLQLVGGFWPGAGPAVNPCPSDIAPSGGNGVVNVADLLAVITSWGACPPGSCPADINHDNVVNVADLLAVINAWGPCP